MKLETAKEIYATAERAANELFSIGALVRQIEDPELRAKAQNAWSRAGSGIWYQLLLPLGNAFPELSPREVPGEPDTILDERGIEAVSKLTADDIDDIDSVLLSHCISLSRKAARVVGEAMSEFDGRFRGIPDSYFLQRLIALAEAGAIEFDGDLRYMRLSEVWLPGPELRETTVTDQSQEYKTRIIVLTGASGAGKTTLLSAVEKLALFRIGCFECDRVAVDEAKSSYPGDVQAAILEYWLKHVGQLDLRVAVLDTQIRPHRALHVLGDLGVKNFEIVLVDCEPEIRNTRLRAERDQPELANAQMDCWAAYLRGQADALGLEVIDTSEEDVSQTARRLRTIVKGI